MQSICKNKKRTNMLKTYLENDIFILSNLTKKQNVIKSIKIYFINDSIIKIPLEKNIQKSTNTNEYQNSL